METSTETSIDNSQHFKRRDDRSNNLEAKILNLKKSIQEVVSNILDTTETMIKKIQNITQAAIKNLRSIKKGLAFSRTNYEFNKQEYYDDYQKKINSEVIKKFNSLVFHKSRNLSPTTQDELRKSLKKLDNIHSLSTSPKEHPFICSSLAKITLSQLNNIQFEPDFLYEYTMKNIVIFQVFFQFLHKPLPSDTGDAWEVIKDLFSLKYSSCSRETFSEKLMKEIEKFDFSNENIDEIELILKEKTFFLDENDDLAYILIPFYYLLKEACVFSGAYKGKGPVFRQISRLEHRLKLFESFNN